MAQLDLFYGPGALQLLGGLYAAVIEVIPSVTSLITPDSMYSVSGPRDRHNPP